jgi:coenzyme F420 hydrogenase subunit beta
MKRKSYEELQMEVWDTGRCSGCGACIAVCPANAINFADGSGAAHPNHSGYCKQVTDGVTCGACYAACPRTRDALAAIRDEGLIGQYLDMFAARAATPVARQQSGGAVTAILQNALSEGTIDAVLTVGEDPWTLRPRAVLITSSEALEAHAGSRYSWWIPALTLMKEAVVTKKLRRLAVTAVPCAALALDAMRKSDNDLLKPFGSAVRLVIGLFCTESFDYRQLVQEVLGKQYGIESWEIRRLNVKGALELVKGDGEMVKIPLGMLEACIRPGCLVCTDFAAEAADISAGSVGSPDGWTTLIVRTRTGKGFVDRAILADALIRGDEIDLTSVERLAAKKAARARKA